MIIHYLEASGFRIIGEPLYINLPEEGRIGVLGQNESGKTTFFQAIECALYGLRRGSGPELDRKNLVTWGKNQAKLEIEFTSGQNRYNLRRTFGSNHLHKAKLMSVINGVKDRSSSITKLTAIERKIEDITGMDRDSFTKLVYIKQKDLDALKELAKSKREQLVNKVMGIEVFDDATDQVKKDATTLDGELENMELQLENVRKNKDDYEAKLNQKSELRTRIEELQPKLENKKDELDIAKALVSKYDWISDYNSTKDLDRSLKEQLEHVEKELKRMSELEEQTSKLKNSMDTYRPEIKALKAHDQKLSDIERRLEEAEADHEMLKTKKQEAIDRLGLPEKDLKLLSEDLQAQKSRRLMFTGGTAIGVLICVVLALLITIGLILGAVALFGLTAYFLTQYLKLDRLVTKNVEIEATNRQLRDQEDKVLGIQKEKASFTSQSAYKTSKDTKEKLDVILSQMKTEIGEETIEGAEALFRNTSAELSKLERADPEARKETIESQIQAKKEEIEELEETKPDSTDEIEYDKEQHTDLKNQCEIIQQEWSDIKEEIDNARGTIKQLEKDVSRLKPDFELFPQLEREVRERIESIKVLKMVRVQLSETSKELRNRVLPHARLIINQILPTLTGNRYSDFEITEDLKFKVHSNQAGGYKEREIFSGGTQDQFLIALRLAFTQSILDSRVMADKYSLLMDECISSSDEVRKQGIFEVLDAMKQTFSQIFIIAHEEIANYVDHHIVFERNNDGFTEIRSKSWA